MKITNNCEKHKGFKGELCPVRLIEENKSLKCCGNCVALYSSCPQMKEQDLLPFNACEHWQWDNMTREERIKG